MKRRDVRGALVDVYSAATRNDLFNHPDIVAKKIIKYPSAYGIVLSGDMKNAAPKFRDYLKVHANDFLKVVEARSKGLVVSIINVLLNSLNWFQKLRFQTLNSIQEHIIKTINMWAAC